MLQKALFVMQVSQNTCVKTVQHHFLLLQSNGAEGNQHNVLCVRLGEESAAQHCDVSNSPVEVAAAQHCDVSKYGTESRYVNTENEGEGKAILGGFCCQVAGI